MRFRDSTIFNFLILRENIRFTTIDNENVIAAVNKIFVIVNEGIKYNASPEYCHINPKMYKPKGIPNINPITVKNRFCVNNNLLKSLLLNPSTLRVEISLSISVNDSNPKLYNAMIAKRQAKNIKT